MLIIKFLKYVQFAQQIAYSNLDKPRFMKLNVLVAEDNKVISNLYSSLLQKRGHQVTITNDGQECLEKYKKEIAEKGVSPFDVIIVDFMMPKINGADLVKEIIKIQPNQRVVFATAYSPNLIKEAIPAKLDLEILQKPMTYASLVNIIERTSPPIQNLS